MIFSRFSELRSCYLNLGLESNAFFKKKITMTKRKIREETRRAPEQSAFGTPYATPRPRPWQRTEDRAGC